MTELGTADSGLLQVYSEDSEPESFTSASYDEEELYSSESELATQPQSRLNLEGPVSHSLSELSLDTSLLEDDVSQHGTEAGGQATPQLSMQERIRQIRLRRHIDGLKKDLKEKETKVEECRVQLLHCREHLNTLLSKEGGLQTSVSELEAGDGATASLGLVRSQLDRVRLEIAAERNVELNIQNELQRAELVLNEARAVMGQFEEAETQLIEQEEVVKELKTKQAIKRLQTESQLVVRAERTRKARERMFSETQRDHEAKTRAALEEAREAQERGRQFLQLSMGQHKKEEAVKKGKKKAQLESKVKAIVSLKRNIESSRGTIQAQQMLKSETAKKKAARELIERERILSKGGNPDQIFLRKHRVESLELSKEAFLKKQTERQVEIINKLLEEEKKLKKAEKTFSKSHWHSRQECPHPTKRLSRKKLDRVKYIAHTSDIQEDNIPSSSTSDEVIHEKNDNKAVQYKVETSATKPAVSTIGVDEANLVEPDIRGLWEGQSSPSVRSKEQSKIKAEKMTVAMEKLKKSIVRKQVVTGREFKGQAFSSKPTEVIFRDFDVGKTYHKKVVLTNISYSFNYCKLLGMTDNLKDFVSIDFNPPGSMSAGLTCYMVVTFSPKLEEDIHGHIEMLSQTGPFTIPVSCLTKKCLISADKKVVDFGSVCVGETVRRYVTLTNSGALPTRFTFSTKTQQPPSLQAPMEVTGDTVSGDPLSDKSMYSIMSTVEPQASRMDTLTVGGPQVKTLSRSEGDLSHMSQKSITWAAGESKADVEAPDSQETDDTKHVSKDANQETAEVEDKELMKVSPEPAPAPSAISVGRVTEGEIQAFSSTSVELVYSPITPSEEKSEFILTFSHLFVSPIVLTGQGCGGELPVWLEREAMDMRVCLLDRLYQDTIVLHNRAGTALRVTFQVPPALSPHLEVLPKYGVIQGGSSYSAQFKFIPRASILGGSCQEFISESGEMVMPVEVQVVDQTQPLFVMVSATISSSELTFDTPSIDFGVCTTQESVVATLHLTNTSLLPQSYGFVSPPAYVDVQPGDGFGLVLPKETLALDVIFSAKKPREYLFELVIKTELDKTYKIPCRGLGVLPALELSQNAIEFSATTLYDTSTSTITVSNPHLGRLNSAVIRGALLPQGPKMFEFVVPPEYPITVCPQVGEVPLGESVSVQVLFSPRLDGQAVKAEALQLAREDQFKQTEEAARMEREKLEMDQQQQVVKKKSKKPDPKKNSLLSTSKNSLSSSEGGCSSTADPDPPEEGSDLWWKAHHALLTQFTNSCLQLSIPCFVSSQGSNTSLNTPSYRVEDTLYLEVTAPMVRPGLMVDCNHGRTVIDYDCVGTGDSKTEMIAVKNVSDQVLKLRSSTLDPHGPFELRNALRELLPGQSSNLIIRFSPLEGGKFCEHLDLSYDINSNLRLKLSGTGVQPDIVISPNTTTFDLGPTMVGDTVTDTLQLTNNCSLAVRYQLTLESSLPGDAERRKKKGLPFRASNFSGEPPFACPSSEGVIEPNGGCNELSILFKPDHQSSAYRDTAYIYINGQRTYTIQLRASAWTNNMYVLQSPQSDDVTPSADLNTEESMIAFPSFQDDQRPPPTPLVLLFTHHLGNMESGEMLRLQSSSNEGLKKGSNKSRIDAAEASDIKVSKELTIGCIKTALVKKAAGECSIESLPSSNPHSKYFSINPPKISVDAGTTRTVLFSFSPPRNPTMNRLEATTIMTLKGDTSQLYKLLLRGLICE